MQEKITVNSTRTLHKKEELKKEISQMKEAAEKLFQCESIDYKKGVKLSILIYGEIERLESLLNKWLYLYTMSFITVYIWMA